MNKTIIHIALYSVVIIVAITVTTLGATYRSNQSCKDLKVVLKNDENNFFLDLEDVRNLVREQVGSPVVGTNFGVINVADIEQGLSSDPYIKNAEVFKDVSGNLVVEVELRKPVARIYPENGIGFYLDQELNKIPLSSHFSANAILVRGNVEEPVSPSDSIENPYLANVAELIKHIDQDPFLKSQISELIIEPNGEIVILPEVGDTPVKFGYPERIEDKFDNLVLFYKEVLNKVGWDKYASINLKYSDQIIAQRK